MISWNTNEGFAKKWEMTGSTGWVRNFTEQLGPADSRVQAAVILHVGYQP